jgi:hypothetical protein
MQRKWVRCFQYFIFGLHERRPKALLDQSLNCMFIGIGILALFACIQNIQWCLGGGGAQAGYRKIWEYRKVL